ncbi:hypothetical protein LIER_30473 [Lithospermum erythrorhizon]|uniref:Uncharacterized protein n=1 Tax=Lithospermum erythrorhizon TaxID=34254 RepID=A0AAV3RPL8_LITER
MECVTTASYSVSINGEMDGHFLGRRDLRQWDPMLPTLFLFCLDYFSRLFRAQAASPDFAFHLMCGEVGITHIAFADGLMLFSRGISLQWVFCWTAYLIWSAVPDLQSTLLSPLLI